MGGYIHPEDVIAYFVEHGGRSTNNELVKYFGDHLTRSPLAPENKKILKKLTGYIATVRRQGTLQSGLGSLTREGKLIVLKNRFQGRSVEDIWSSLVLSLSREELTFLVPAPQPLQPGEQGTDGAWIPVVELKESGPSYADSLERDVGKRQAIYFSGQENLTLERLEEQLEAPITHPPLIVSSPLAYPQLSASSPLYPPSLSASSPLYHPPLSASSPLYPPPLSASSQIYPLPLSASSPLYDPPLSASSPFVHEDVILYTPNREHAKENEVDFVENSATLANTTAAASVATPTKIATTSVRDLRLAYDKFASTSNLSLLDHVAGNKKEREVSKPGRAAVRPSSGEDIPIHLSPERKAWLSAALRLDYSTLLRMATADPSLVTTRDPANGYTALHWAARRGHVELVKLLAGRFGLSPDMRTRGGYTPLIIAAMGKCNEVYDLLVDTYLAREDIRDNSGHTATYYLENHIQVPGFPSSVAFSHDVDMVDRGPTKGRRRVERHSTQHFIRGIKDSIRTSLRDGIKESFREVGGGIKESWRDNLMITSKRRNKSTSSYDFEEE